MFSNETKGNDSKRTDAARSAETTAADYYRIADAAIVYVTIITFIHSLSINRFSLPRSLPRLSLFSSVLRTGIVLLCYEILLSAHMQTLLRWPENVQICIFSGHLYIVYFYILYS
jgi:hypothetical protein